MIPIFCKAYISDGQILINGDGETSRDFTYVDNAVRLNDLSIFTQEERALNQVYNAACGDQVRLNEMVSYLASLKGRNVTVSYGPERLGDVKHSKADISKASARLGYSPKVKFLKV